MKSNGYIRTLEYWIGRGIKILHTLPSGWKELKSACIAPEGYKWVSNGKSMFGGEFKHALLKI